LVEPKKLELELGFIFLFFFVGTADLLLTPKLVWLGLKNLSSSLGPYFGPMLELGFLFFPFLQELTSYSWHRK